MRVIDLSHPLNTDMEVYPGDRPVRLVRAHPAEGITVTELELTAHAGTHVDAPGHLTPGETTIDRIPPARFMGLGAVVDVTHCDGPISAEDLAELKSVDKLDFALIRTGWDAHWSRGDYFEGHPYLSEDAARFLAGLGLGGVGVDTPSPDRDKDYAFPVHRIFMEAGMVIVENLRGLDLLPKTFRFFCLPLRIKDGDGSPVRAVAVVDDYPEQTARA